MTPAVQFYISTILVFFGVNLIACWALNLQFGMTGLLNLAFIVFVAVGAYTAAVLTLGSPANNGGFQQYIGGAELPFPLPIVAAAVVGGLLSAALGAITLRRLRRDFQAIVMLVVSLIATDVATNDVNLVNGSYGLSLVPAPLS